MAKGRDKSGGTRNDNRKCGKAWKKKPRKQRKTGRTIGGYSPAKLKQRELKRQQPYIPPKENNHNE